MIHLNTHLSKRNEDVNEVMIHFKTHLSKRKNVNEVDDSFEDTISKRNEEVNEVMIHTLIKEK